MPLLIGDLGDYDRWKSDPDWGRREENCKHCGTVKGECDRIHCASCGTQTCSESLVCNECDEADSKGCQFCRGPMWQCWEVECDRCGTAGCSNTMIAEEGDEWECPPCNERENARERDENR